MIKKTPFPTRPRDVAALTPPEFTFALDTDAPSLDAVCARFRDDANRALVWVVRFSALKALIDRADWADWFGAGPSARDVCEVAATFSLNDRWEFDRDGFRSAVDALVSKRARNRHA
jgi:hypothetical protein